MSQINSVGPSPIQKLITNPVYKQVPAGAPAPMPATDKVELSSAQASSPLSQSSDIRAAKVADVKAQINAGAYDPDGSKLDGAIDKLLDELNK